MTTQTTYKRPFMTQYFKEADASGKRPVSMGYAASIKGARRNMAVRIVLGQYGLAIVADRGNREVLSTMRRTKMGLTIKDMKNPDANTNADNVTTVSQGETT